MTAEFEIYLQKQIMERDHRIRKLEKEAIHWKSKVECVAELIQEYKYALGAGIDTKIKELIEDLESITR